MYIVCTALRALGWSAFFVFFTLAAVFLVSTVLGISCRESRLWGLGLGPAQGGIPWLAGLPCPCG